MRNIYPPAWPVITSIVMFVAWALAPSAAPAAQQRRPIVEQCRTTTLSHPIGKIAATLWLSPLEQILVADRENSLVRAYTLSGELLASAALPAGDAPYLLARLNSGLYMFRTDLTVARSDLSFQNPEIVNLKAPVATKAHSPYRLETIWSEQVAVLKDGLIGAYGTLGQADKNNIFPVFTYQLAPGLEGSRIGTIERLLEPTFDPAYAVGNRYIAALDGALYFLGLGDPTYDLYRLVPGAPDPPPMNGFPFSDLATPASDPELRQRLQDQLIEQSLWLERNEMIAGLYAHNGSLFALYKHRHAALEGTRWELHQLRIVDEGTVEAVAVYTLPTNSEHLRLVPAGDQWLLFPLSTPSLVRGEELRISQEARHMIVIPNALLDDPVESPLERSSLTGIPACAGN